MTPDHSIEQTRIREIAKEYRERGYRVTLDPDVDVRPDFLADFRPDLIAVTDDDRVVVEVVAHGAAGERRLTELARTIDSQDGWRLEVVLLEPRNGVSHSGEEIISRDAVRAVLEESRKLMELSLLHSALLRAWGALEATLRAQLEYQSRASRLSSPAVLLKEAVMEGLLSREAYHQLMDISALRNRVAHGYESPEVDASVVGHLITITEELSKGEPTSHSG